MDELEFNMSQFGSCLWCTDPDRMSSLLSEYCQSPPPEWADGVEHDMTYCLDCVVEYHEAKQEFIIANPEKAEKLTKLELSRLTRDFKTALNDSKELDELEDVVRVPIMEILKYPYLLHDHNMDDLFCDAICTLERNGNGPEITDILPGVYLLLVHPNYELRNWAIKKARDLPPVMPSDYEDIQQVISWMISVIDFGLFEYPDMGDMAEKYTILPSHLFCTKSVTDYWIGISVLLSSLDSVAVCSKLMRKPGGHRTLVDALIITIEECKMCRKDANKFWPALQCFIVLLEKLGFRMWQYLSKDPNSVLQIITNHPVYLQELDSLDHCPGSCLFDTSLNKRTSPRNKSKKKSGTRKNDCPSIQQYLPSSGCCVEEYKAPFSFFLPFVKSLLDFGSLATKLISSAVQFLAKKAEHIFFNVLDEEMDMSPTPNNNPRLPSKCPLVEQCISRLLELLELFIKHKQFSLALPDATLWIQLFLDYIHFVPKNVSDGSVKLLTNIQRKCEEFILHLLKVGVRLKYDDDCKKLFSIINRNKRNPRKSQETQMWGLTYTDISKLTNSIRTIITKLAANPPMKDDLFNFTKKQLPAPSELQASEDDGDDVMFVSITADTKTTPCSKLPPISEPRTMTPPPPIPRTEEEKPKPDDAATPMDTHSDGTDDDYAKYKLNHVSDDEIHQKVFLKTEMIEDKVEDSNCSNNHMPFVDEPQIVDDCLIKEDSRAHLVTMDNSLHQTDNTKYMSEELKQFGRIIDSDCDADDEDEDDVSVQPCQQEDDGAADSDETFVSEDDENTEPIQKLELVNTSNCDSGEPQTDNSEIVFLDNCVSSNEVTDINLKSVRPSLFENVGFPKHCLQPDWRTDSFLPFGKTNVEIFKKVKIENFDDEDDDIIFISDVDPSEMQLNSNSVDAGNSVPIPISDEVLVKSASNSNRVSMDTNKEIQSVDFNDLQSLKQHGIQYKKPLVVLKKLTESEIKESFKAKKVVSNESSDSDCVPLWSLASKNLESIPEHCDSPGNKAIASNTHTKAYQAITSDSDTDEEVMEHHKFTRTRKSKFSLWKSSNLESESTSDNDTSPLKHQGLVQQHLNDSSSFQRSQENIKRPVNRVSPLTRPNLKISSLYEAGFQSTIPPNSTSDEDKEQQQVSTCNHDRSANTDSGLPITSQPNRANNTNNSNGLEIKMEETNDSSITQASAKVKTEPSDSMSMITENCMKYEEDVAARSIKLEQCTCPADTEEEDIPSPFPVTVQTNSNQESTEKISSQRKIKMECTCLDTEHNVERSTMYGRQGIEACDDWQNLGETKTPQVKEEGRKRKQLMMETVSLLSDAESEDEGDTVFEKNSSPRKIKMEYNSSNEHNLEKSTLYQRRGKEECKNWQYLDETKTLQVEDEVSERDTIIDLMSPEKQLDKEVKTQKEVSGHTRKQHHEKRYASFETRIDHRPVKRSKMLPCHTRNDDDDDETKALSLNSRSREDFISETVNDNLMVVDNDCNEVLDDPTLVSTVPKDFGSSKYNKEENTTVSDDFDEFVTLSTGIFKKKTAKHSMPSMGHQSFYCSKKSQKTIMHSKSKLIKKHKSLAISPLCANKVAKNILELKAQLRAREKAIDKLKSNPLESTFSLKNGRSTESTIDENKCLDFDERQELPVESRDTGDHLDQPVNAADNLHVSVDPKDKEYDLDQYAPLEEFQEFQDDFSTSAGSGVAKVFGQQRFASRTAGFAQSLTETATRAAKKVVADTSLKKARDMSGSVVQKTSLSTDGAVAIQAQIDNSTTRLMPYVARPSGDVTNRTSTQSFASSNHSRKEVGKVKALSNQLPAPNMDLKKKVTLDDFHQIILQWDTNWLTQKGFHPDFGNLRPSKVPETFNSPLQFYEVFYPLHLLETWAMISKDWHEACDNGTVIELDAEVTERETVPKNMMVLVCKVESTHVQFKLSEGDLLVLGMPMQDGSATDATVQIFGLVTFVTKLKVDGRLENTNNKLKVHIKVVYRSFMLGNRILKIKVLTSLISAQRQLSCFQSLTKSILARDILRPRTNTFTIRHNNSHYTDIAKTNYNESQLQAVYGTSQAALESYPLPRICMVQGPPGTGKSHTIVGIVENILIGQRNLPTSLEKNRILLCAPSNAGVDQLMRRLVHHLISISRNKYNSNFNCGDFNVVRVGRHSSIHPDVLKYSLDDVVKSRLAKEVARVSTDAVSLIKKQLEDLDTMIGDAEKICCSLKLQGNISELTVAEAERDKLQNQRNELEKANRKQVHRMRSCYREESKIRLHVLNEADVVCCTLNGSGSSMLDSALKMNTSAGQLRKCHFKCVIIDEAGQCTELDTLIPLQYGSSKLILVGDPLQLPATVISKHAQNLGYGQSLFERFYNYFKSRPDNPMLMLDRQYRMHKEICHFPAQQFYGGKLSTSSNVLKRTDEYKFPFHPYKVIDVVRGREVSQRPGHIVNYEEADMIMNILRVVDETQRVINVGIITPYKAQKQHLRLKLRDRNFRGNCQIEINTVDGFQGREKDIIILSCVRAKNATGSIGFVADDQRLNVSLTRAKLSLFILGHLDSLKTCSGWLSLINDAYKRGAIIKALGPNYYEIAKRCRLESWLPAVTASAAISDDCSHHNHVMRKRSSSVDRSNATSGNSFHHNIVKSSSEVRNKSFSHKSDSRSNHECRDVCNMRVASEQSNYQGNKSPAVTEKNLANVVDKLKKKYSSTSKTMLLATAKDVTKGRKSSTAGRNTNSGMEGSSKKQNSKDEVSIRSDDGVAMPNNRTVKSHGDQNIFNQRLKHQRRGSVSTDHDTTKHSHQKEKLSENAKSYKHSTMSHQKEYPIKSTSRSREDSRHCLSGDRGFKANHSDKNPKKRSRSPDDKNSRRHIHSHEFKRQAVDSLSADRSKIDSKQKHKSTVHHHHHRRPGNNKDTSFKKDAKVMRVGKQNGEHLTEGEDLFSGVNVTTNVTQFENCLERQETTNIQHSILRPANRVRYKSQKRVSFSVDVKDNSEESKQKTLIYQCTSLPRDKLPAFQQGTH